MDNKVHAFLQRLTTKLKELKLKFYKRQLLEALLLLGIKTWEQSDKPITLLLNLHKEAEQLRVKHVLEINECRKPGEEPETHHSRQISIFQTEYLTW
jgi:hypothetical protein